MPSRSGKFLTAPAGVAADQHRFDAGRMRRFAPTLGASAVYKAAPAQRGRLRSPSICAAYSTMGTILP
jgi:hypothetical protein